MITTNSNHFIDAVQVSVVMATHQVEKVQYVERAKKIYADELLPRYLNTHKGAYLVIDGRSGDYEIAEGWDTHVFQRLKRRHPNAITFSTRVGMGAAGDIFSGWKAA